MVDPAAAVREAIERLETTLLEQLRAQLRDLGPVHAAAREDLVALIDNELAKRAGRVN